MGPRMSDEGSAVENEEEIDLDEFYKEYIRPGRGSATVVAEADDPEAGARIKYLLNAIERDQHALRRPFAEVNTTAPGALSNVDGLRPARPQHGRACVLPA